MKIYEQIVFGCVQQGSRVIDLGCGNGALLHHIMDKKGCEGYGIERDFSLVMQAIGRGIPVYQGDILDGLRQFDDGAFDMAILSQTLQQILCPVDVMTEMCRVAKQAIVTFPNFGHWRIRYQLMVSGMSPKTDQLPYDWYNTPNIRVMTIRDFRGLCADNGFTILKDIPLMRHTLQRWLFPLSLTNVVAKKGIFLIAKTHPSG